MYAVCWCILCKYVSENTSLHLDLSSKMHLSWAFCSEEINVEVGIIILLKVMHLPKKTTTSNFQRPRKSLGTPRTPPDPWDSPHTTPPAVGVRSAATAAGRRGLVGPSLESFNGGRVHLLTVIFLRGYRFYPLPVPKKKTWFKVGKKNNPLPKTKQRYGGGFLESFGSIQISNLFI